MSVVEQSLRGDPAGVYSNMDFGTRDHYRHVIEAIAKRSPLTEYDVSLNAIHLARQGESKKGSTDRKSHVGYYLVDKGRLELERMTHMRHSIASYMERLASKQPLLLYVGGIGVISMLVTAEVFNRTTALHGHRFGLWFMALLLFVSATHLGVGLVNWLTTMFVRPNRLPRMDFSEGIPEEFSTLVVVPTMLVTNDGVKRLLEGLEVRYLANRDPHLRFCLLTDVRDANVQVLPEDDGLIALAGAGIESMNAKYRDHAERENNRDDSDSLSTDIFFLLHRPRRWNPQEQVWMGYERKRGKLGELNSLLLRGSTEGFSQVVGDIAQLSHVKYVITLDTDTLLPRDVAKQLVGTMAHPLNRAQVDPRRNIVVEGYGILQPGVAVRFEKARPSWFLQLFGGEPGIDPYTRTISDVYQDVFHEGSFIGKGIYDVDVFSATIDGRFPENQILSHDLLEGCYARSGLVSDVCVFESFPSNYQSDVSRRHRWIRGDWQIAGWLLPATGNPISLLSRWKILDNLRRSIVPFVVTLLLILAWLDMTRAGFLTAVVVGIMVIPSVCVSLVASFRKPTDLPLVQHLRKSFHSTGVSLVQSAFTIAFLPFEACFSLDAIVRTIVRGAWTHRHMLEWKTASDAERDGTGDVVSWYRTMWVAPILSIVVTGLLMACRPDLSGLGVSSVYGLENQPTDSET